MFEYLIGGFVLGIFAGVAIVNTWNYFWETHGERPFKTKLSERMRSWFEDGVTPFESQIHAWADEVAALETNYAIAIEANVAVAKRNADIIAENAGLELMIMEGAEHNPCMAVEAELKQALDAFGLTWGDLEGFGSACEGIADTMEKDQADNLRFVIANAEVANLNADLQIENIGLREIETESAAVIAMARSFANFPSWLENLEAALASDDLSKLTTQQKPTLEAMLRASPSCGMDGCLWEREEMPSPVDL